MRLRNLVLVLVGGFFACQQPFLPEPEPTGPWESLEHRSQQVILNLHATPFEVYAITEGEFIRFDKRGELEEDRSLDKLFGTRGTPVLSDNALARVKIGDAAEQVLEFHMTRLGADVVRFTPDDFLQPDDNTILFNLPSGFPFGAFDSDGRRFLMPVRVFGEPKDHLALLLFDVRQNATFTQFQSVELLARIDLLELGASENIVTSVRCLEDNFYVTTQGGAWRVTPDGSTTKIFSNWTLDAFETRGNLYVTGFNAYEFQVSFDDGLSWDRVEDPSALRYVQVSANDQTFAQPTRGAVFGISYDLTSVTPLVYHDSIPVNDPAKFFGVAYLDDWYYFSADKTIWRTNELVAE